jgi:hypothetical protein
VWVDRNANGDLTDDLPVKIVERGPNSTPSSARWYVTASVDVAYGAEKHTLGLRLYYFHKANPKATLANKLYYYRAYGYAGTISLGNTSYPALLVDDTATGDFRNETGAGRERGVNLILDLNGNGKVDSKTEKFDTRLPFNIRGTTYEISGMTARGETFTIFKSSETVPERVPAP